MENYTAFVAEMEYLLRRVINVSLRRAGETFFLLLELKINVVERGTAHS